MGVFTLGSVQIDLDRHFVDRDGTTERLTTIEADCLRYLVDAGRAVSRDELHANVWRYADASLSRACDTTIHRLRLKIEDDPARPEVVITVHGVGYRVVTGRPEPAPPIAPVSTPGAAPRRFRLGDRTLDLDRLAIEHEGAAIALTGREAALLEALIAAPGGALERDALCIRVWGGTAGRPLENAVSRIRRKLEADPRQPRVLVTTAVGYRLDLPDAPGVVAGAAELAALPLPAEPDRRFGRDAEIDAVVRGLGGGDRLFTLTGAPGVGKTRVALAVAHGLRAAGRRVAWVEGAEVHTERALCAAIAAALRLPLLGAATADGLARAVALDGELVLALDNLEQVVGAGLVVERLLAGAPGLSVVATSRGLLRIRGERTLTVPPLPRGDAAALFADRAPRPPRDDEQEDVLALCDDVDRLPLAIELAAARTRVLSTAQIRAQAGAGLRLLADGGRSVRTSLDASWAIAPAWARAALRALAVFETRFTHDAAEAVLGPADGGPGWTIDVLQELCDASLLRYDSDLRRFAFLRVVREYVAEQLGAEDRAQAEVRHGRWFAGTLDRTGSGDVLHGPRRFEILATLAAELPDLVATIDRAVARSDADCAIAACLAAWEVWAVHGPYADAVDAADRVCALALSPSQQARAELVAGLGRIALGEPARAEQHLVDVRSLAHQLGLAEVELAAYRGLARLYVGGARHAEARQAIDDGRALAARIGSWSSDCGLLMRLALLESDHDVARRALLDAERLAKTHDAHGMLMSIARRLGEVAVRQGRVDVAERQFLRARVLGRGAGDALEAACVDSNEASLFRLIGRHDEAALRARAAMRGFRRVGDRAAEGKAAANLGLALIDVGRFDEAEVALLHALDAARVTRERLEEVMALQALGVLAAQRTDRDEPLDEALTWFREAMALSAELGESNKEIVSRMNLGRVCCLRGDSAEGVALLYGALDLCELIGDTRRTGEVLAMLVACLADADRLAEADARLADAADIAGEVNDRALLLHTRRLSVGLWARLGRLDAAEAALAELGDDSRESMLERAELWAARAELAHARGDALGRREAVAQAVALAPASTLGQRFRALAAS